MTSPTLHTRSIDILIRRTFARLVWGIAGAMVATGLIQCFLPRLPRSQAWISLGLGASLALLAHLLRRMRPSRSLQDFFWLMAVAAISLSLALRNWVDPNALRPYILLIVFPMAGIFIRGRAATLALWMTQASLALLTWGMGPAHWHRPDLFLVNLTFFMAIGMWLQHLVGDLLKRMEARLVRLAEARREIQALEGMIPICAHCKKVRNDTGYWEQVEGYLTRRRLALFSHGICPDCLEEVRREMETLKGSSGSRVR